MGFQTAIAHGEVVEEALLQELLVVRVFLRRAVLHREHSVARAGDIACRLEEPLHCKRAGCRIARQIASAFLSGIQDDRARLRQRKRLAARSLAIDDDWNETGGIELEEFGAALLSL